MSLRRRRWEWIRSATVRDLQQKGIHRRNNRRLLSHEPEVMEQRILLTNSPFYKTMTIDGNFSDWSGISGYTDPANNTHDTDHSGASDTPVYVNHPDVDLLEYKAAYDDNNLYFYFKSTGIIGRTQSQSPGKAAGRYYVIVTMDVDQSNTTGYNLYEGGYYPSTSGYDMNSEIEFYNGTFNSGNYLNHGARNQAELNQAFLDQSSGQWVSGNDGPYPAGILNVLPGSYDFYDEWVYHSNDTLTFVRDKGPVVLGVIEQAISADGHELEMIVPYVGFLKDQNGTPIVGLGSTLDLSFSLEASGELAPDGTWASNTAAPMNGFYLAPPDQTSNHAPVLDNRGNPVLNSISEDLAVANNPGTLVSTMLASLQPGGGLSDSDIGDLQGIAIIGANQNSGIWQYSLDNGSKWTSFGSTSSSSALQLAADSQTRVRFLPNANYAGDVGFTFVAWDRTFGSNGTKRSAIKRGGTTSFSLEKETALISVIPVQDAPVLNPAGAPHLNSISEDEPATDNVGTYISDILSSMAPNGGINNIDQSAEQGIAIIGANQNNGTWQFSTNDGGTWSSFGVTNSANALLLASDGGTRIRFVPKKDYNGSVGFTFLAWDQTFGKNGGVASTVVRGGGSAFSLAKETALILITAVNDAPVLNDAGSPQLPAIPGNISDSSHLGVFVSELIASMGPTGGITDVDIGFSRGIGVIGSNQNNGVWQYSTNGGSTWTGFGNTSSSSALLLGASTRIRFKPNPGFSGVVAFTFVAWDFSNGIIGERIDATNRGLTSSLSLGKDRASLVVT